MSADALRTAAIAEMARRTLLELTNYEDLLDEWVAAEQQVGHERTTDPASFAKAFTDWYIRKYDLEDCSTRRKMCKHNATIKSPDGRAVRAVFDEDGSIRIHLTVPYRIAIDRFYPKHPDPWLRLIPWLEGTAKDLLEGEKT